MSINLACKSNASKGNAEVNNRINSKSPMKTNSIGAAARLEAFTNLTCKKKRRRERKGKSPKRAFAKEVGWSEIELKTDTRN